MTERANGAGRRDEFSSTPGDLRADALPGDDLPGDQLGNDDLVDAEPYAVADDEAEAEELGSSPAGTGATAASLTQPAAGTTGDVVIDDEAQLVQAESVAALARSARPQRRPAVIENADAPVSRRRGGRVVAKQRTTPAQFVRESVDELKKVVWPTGTQVRQYFTVVLIFVLVIIAYVGLLDLGFGAALLRLFG